MRHPFRVCSNLSRIYVDIRSLKTKNCLFSNCSPKAVDKTLIGFWRTNHGVLKVACLVKRSPNAAILDINDDQIYSYYYTFIYRGGRWVQNKGAFLEHFVLHNNAIIGVVRSKFKRRFQLKFYKKTLHSILFGDDEGGSGTGGLKEVRFVFVILGGVFIVYFLCF